MKRFYIFSLVVFLLSGLSCKKFLAEYSQNQTYITSAADLDELLVGEVYAGGMQGNQYLLDDDLQQNPALTSSAGMGFPSFGVHYWQRLPEIRGDGTTIVYGETYKLAYRKIAALNTILFNIPLLIDKGQSAGELRRIAGEAHFLRAALYLLLVNTYGKPYNVATAVTDYGVPLKISSPVELGFFARASVIQVYGQIEADLLEAEKELQGMNEVSVIRPNMAAVQALLSRLYLYKENYEQARVYADKVMQNRYRVLDINSMAADAPFLVQASPEIIFARSDLSGSSQLYKMWEASRASDPDNYQVSDDLLAIFSPHDLRPQAFFKFTAEGDVLAHKVGELPQTNVGGEFIIRLPEIYLNKAEALAILGQHDEAIATLQALRKNRFQPEHLTEIRLQGAALVNFIREERRRELCFEMHRWFDLRRYGVNSRYAYGKTIRHRSFDYNSSGRYIRGYYELKPYAEDQAAYVLPIPDEEILFNQGVLTNEPRRDRPLITE